MIFTLAGAFIGLTGSYFICEKIGMIEVNSNTPSTGDFIVVACTVIGAGIGFDYGTQLLNKGEYPEFFMPKLK